MGASLSPSRTRRFDQTALATPANFLTLGRMLLGVPTLVLMSRHGASWLTVALWFVITSTDSLDGFLARRDGARFFFAEAQLLRAGREEALARAVPGSLPRSPRYSDEPSRSSAR